MEHPLSNPRGAVQYIEGAKQKSRVVKGDMGLRHIS